MNSYYCSSIVTEYLWYSVFKLPIHMLHLNVDDIMMLF